MIKDKKVLKSSSTCGEKGRLWTKEVNVFEKVLFERILTVFCFIQSRTMFGFNISRAFRGVTDAACWLTWLRVSGFRLSIHTPADHLLSSTLKSVCQSDRQSLFGLLGKIFPQVVALFELVGSEKKLWLWHQWGLKFCTKLEGKAQTLGWKRVAEGRETSDNLFL